jgi:uncharacterized membrane protein
LTRRHDPPPEVPAEDPGIPSPVREAWERRAAFALLFIAPAFFATNMLTARAMADHVPPVALAFGRWSATLAILLVFVGPTLWRERQVLRAEWRHFLTLGALGMGVCGVFVYIGADTTTATNIGLIYATSPIMITAIAWRFLGEARLASSGSRRSSAAAIRACCCVSTSPPATSGSSSRPSAGRSIRSC